MNKLLRLISSSLLLLTIYLIPSHVDAATFRSGENITITERLKDLYAAGGSVDITAPITNDLVVAGGNVRITENVSNSIIAAGGNVTITGDVGNTIRAAGGNLVIEGPVDNDVVVAGGTVTIAENARVNGDVVITGGTLRINGPVRGNIHAGGEDVYINNAVGGTIWAETGKLTLGPQAEVAGDLNYTSSEKAHLENGATVNGKQNFKQAEHNRHEDKKEDAGSALVAGILYKLITSIIVTLLFIWLLPRFLHGTSETMARQPLRTGLFGFATLILMPVLSGLLLLFIWLGIASFLLYFLLLILSVIVVNAFVGWLALSVWHGRDKRTYALDWKAGIIGPLITTILWLIPILGWLIIFVLWLMGIGVLVIHLFDWVHFNKGNKTLVHDARSAKTPAGKK